MGWNAICSAEEGQGLFRIAILTTALFIAEFHVTHAVSGGGPRRVGFFVIGAILQPGLACGSQIWDTYWHHRRSAASRKSSWGAPVGNRDPIRGSVRRQFRR
jgi:hypothetical protein